MRRDKLITAVLLATLVVFSASYAYAEDFVAHLNGFQEIGRAGRPNRGDPRQWHWHAASRSRPQGGHREVDPDLHGRGLPPGRSPAP
mgnify:CR=1 FL=1